MPIDGPWQKGRRTIDGSSMGMRWSIDGPWMGCPGIPTRVIHYSKIASYHNGQNSTIIKNTIPSVRAAETQYKGSFYPTMTILLVFIIKMLQPAETNLHAKMCKKLR